MACHYCKKEGHANVPDTGNCAECTKLVCTNPSGRGDNKYHAEECFCGCGKIVCVHEILKHSTGHKSTVQNCFPELSLLSGLDAAVASVNSLVSYFLEPPTMEVVISRMNFFLFSISPGLESLRDAELFSRYYSEEDNRMSLDFYGSPARRSKVYILSLDMLSKAWANLYHNFDSNKFLESRAAATFQWIQNYFSYEATRKKDLSSEKLGVIANMITDFSRYHPLPYVRFYIRSRNIDSYGYRIPNTNTEIANWLMSPSV